jgi:hypothetical protein
MKISQEIRDVAEAEKGMAANQRNLSNKGKRFIVKSLTPEGEYNSN